MLSSRSPAQVGFVVVEKISKSRWFWPLGVIATSLAGAAVVLFRGCWHTKMSWPVSSSGHGYQVCLGCGIKRLFDEKSFRSYGPYSYDLTTLLAWDNAHHGHTTPPPAHAHRPAS